MSEDKENKNEFKITYRITQPKGIVSISSGKTTSEENCLIIESTCEDIRENAYKILDGLYDYRRDYIEGFCPVRMGERWGFVNCLLEKVVDTIYDDYEYIGCGCFMVKLNEKWHCIEMINSERPIILDGSYDDIVCYSNRGMALVKYDNKYGIFSAHSKKIIMIFDNVKYARGSDYIRCFFKINNKWGFAKNDKILIQPMFDRIVEQDYFYKYIKDEKYKGYIGYIDNEAYTINPWASDVKYEKVEE